MGSNGVWEPGAAEKIEAWDQRQRLGDGGFDGKLVQGIEPAISINDSDSLSGFGNEGRFAERATSGSRAAAKASGMGA